MSNAPPAPGADVLLHWMQRALELARQAERQGEVPVGAVVVGPAGDALAEAFNRTEELRDPSAHAELLALRGACAASGTTRLPAGSLLVVTLEPCAMCAGAIVLARPRWLCFGAADPKAGACGSLLDLVRDPRLNHRVELLPGPLAGECGELLSAFFRARRNSAGRDCRDRPRSL